MMFFVSDLMLERSTSVFDISTVIFYCHCYIHSNNALVRASGISSPSNKFLLVEIGGSRYY